MKAVYASSSAGGNLPYQPYKAMQIGLTLAEAEKATHEWNQANGQACGIAQVLKIHRSRNKIVWRAR